MEKLLGKNYINRIRILLTLFLFIILLTILYIYRPYIYSSSINDYSLANSLPSLIYTLAITQVSFIYTSVNKTEFSKSLQMYSIALGLILAEIIQLFTNTGTFDLIDIIYILMSIPVSGLVEKIFKSFNC